MKRSIFYSALFLTLSLLASCSTMQKSSNKTNASAVNPQTQNPTAEEIIRSQGDAQASTMPLRPPLIMLDTLAMMKIDGMWTLRTINGVTLSAEKGDNENNRPYICFDSRQAKFYANDGCNTINGDFRVTGQDKLTVNPLLSTMMLCPDAPYEHQFKQGLANVASFRKEEKNDENLLSLYNSGGSLIMTLARPMTDFLNGSWRITEIDGKKIDNTDVKMVIDIPELKVHGRTGCNTFNGSIFVDPDKDGSLQFHQVGTTRMLCPDMETEQAFLVALESVEFARQTSTGAVLMNKNHETVLTLVPLPLTVE